MYPIKRFKGMLLFTLCLALCLFNVVDADARPRVKTRGGYSEHSILFCCLDDDPISVNRVGVSAPNIEVSVEPGDVAAQTYPSEDTFGDGYQQYENIVCDDVYASDLNGLSEVDIIEKVSPLFVQNYRDTGILASVSLAQFCVESGFGRSELAVNANNVFGMKAEISHNTWEGSVWDGTVYTKQTAEQLPSGQYVNVVADFRSYPRINDSVIDHSAYLLHAEDNDGLRYEGLAWCDDYEKAVDIVASGGYATSHTYRQKLLNKISEYDLTKYDKTSSGSVSVSRNGHDRNKLIVIDAGHQLRGNSEKEPVGPGATEMKAKVSGGTKGVSTGIPEYKLTLDVSLKLRDELESRGYKVLMVRETNDVNISNAERAEFANEHKADAFLRIHANGSENSSAHGALTICQTASNPYNAGYHDTSKKLATKVLDGLCNKTGAKRERVWETDTMTGINWCKVPATIIEMGYMTNAEEDKKLCSDDYQTKIVQGIADGVDAYFE